MATKRAVALRYQHESDAAPKVVAKGSGEVAEAMIRVAQAHQVSLYESGSLVESLFRMETDSAIPEELYAVVAEVLAFVYRSQNR